MTQEKVFKEVEGDAWFERNRDAILKKDDSDWPVRAIKMLGEDFKPEKILELGCCNGYRLSNISKFLGSSHVGVEISDKAVKDGKERYPNLELHQGSISEVPLNRKFDLIVVNFVLHWVDRNLISKSIAEIDRLLEDGGILVLGDFLPNDQRKRNYHHCKTEEVFTYKQDYSKAFEAIGTFKETIRICYNHEEPFSSPHSVDPENRAVCSVLKKSLNGYYFTE